MRRWIGSLLPLLLALTACQGIAGPATCASFTALQSEMGETFAFDEFADLIHGQYSLRKSEDVELQAYTDLAANFSWQSAGYRYSASLDDDARFTWFGIERVGLGKVRARHVLACFGTPEYYRAVHDLGISGASYEELELFYPTAGILADGARFYASLETRPIEDDFPSFRFLITQPGTIEEMLVQIYDEPDPFEEGPVRAWPGDWEDIVISVTPTMQRLQSAP